MTTNNILRKQYQHVNSFFFKFKTVLIVFFGGLISLTSAPLFSEEPPRIQGKVMYRFHADEAVQGTAVDDRYLYVIADAAIGKYDKKTGKKLAVWKEKENGPVCHLNAGVIDQGKLYTAHSNWPTAPVESSVEIFDTVDLKPLKSFSYGILQQGTLTWLDVRNGTWFAAFSNYDAVETYPGRNSNWSYIARLDDKRMPVESWTFPKDLIKKFDGYAASGGAFDADGLLYVSGHKAGELYQLEFPQAGSTLRWTATVEAPFGGQAFSIDKATGYFYTINKKTSEVIVIAKPK